MKHLLILLLILFGSIQSLQSQMYFHSPFEQGYFSPHFSFSGETYFNANDMLLDIGVGLDDRGWDYSAMLNVGFRPFIKKIRVQEDNQLFQYRERVYFISLDLEKRFQFFNFGDRREAGLYVSSKIGYFFGNYRGVSEYPNNRWMIVPATGLSVQLKHAILSLGYMNFNNKSNATNHMVQLKAAFTLEKKEDN